MSMTQTGSLVHVNIYLKQTVYLRVAYCVSATSPCLSLANYAVVEVRKIFCCWQFGWVTVQRVLSWFWLNLENSLTLWREFERSQSSKNQSRSSIPRWIALWMYHAEHNQWYQWKWQLRKLHTVVNNPVIAWYKQIVLICWPDRSHNTHDTRLKPTTARPPAGDCIENPVIPAGYIIQRAIN